MRDVLNIDDRKDEVSSGIRSLYYRARRSFISDLLAWVRCRSLSLPNVSQLAEATMRVSDPAEEEGSGESPIFVLSTGWRSGSTLLQRILVTDPRLILWGEPLGDVALIPGIAETVSRMSKVIKLRENYISDNVTPRSMPTTWIALLYPPGEDFRLALRGFFDRWLGSPARQRGFVRWGLKEVRLSATEAAFLHWLYPNAKFLMISRHPYDGYRSLCDATWRRVYYRCPDISVHSAAAFARHWNRLALSWSELPPEFPLFHIKYEELIDDGIDFRRLETWLGVEIREAAALSASVGATARSRLSWHERWIIRSIARRGMQALGYPPGNKHAERPRLPS